MPDAAEIGALVLELDHRRDAGKAVEAFDERILDRRAERLREAHELRRRELLVAKENHAVLEPRAADGVHGVGGKFAREIDPVDLGAECAGDFPDFHSGCGRRFRFGFDESVARRSRVAYEYTQERATG